MLSRLRERKLWHCRRKTRREDTSQSEAAETTDSNSLISECRKEDSNLHALAGTRT
jgi:hypothetical protein